MRARRPSSSDDLPAAELLPPSPLVYEPVIRQALAEDLGLAGDLTTDLCVPATARAAAALVTRAPGRVAGLPVALAAFRLLAPELRVGGRVVGAVQGQLVRV